MTKSQKESSVVVVGAGFAGFNAARELSRLVGASTELVVINSADYFLYLPLMPQVAGGLVEPRHICVSLSRRLRHVRFVLGDVHHVDPVRKTVSWAGPEGASGQVSYDRLILTVGSVNKLLPIPGGGRLRPWLSQHRRSHLPARPHHPPARASRRRH